MRVLSALSFNRRENEPIQQNHVQPPLQALQGTLGFKQRVYEHLKRQL